MPWKKKKVPATTNNVMRGIINFLLSKGHSASRVNVQGQWDENTETWRKSGSRLGVYDIIAVVGGQPVAIDVKKGRDTLSKEQIEFKNEWEKAGGITFEAESLAAFIAFYDNIPRFHLLIPQLIK